VEDPDEAADAINEDLDRLSTWAKTWKVEFSPPKTEDLLISKLRNSPVHPDLKLDLVTIKRVEHHKHLGITFSKDLSWGKHIEEITDKASRRLGILRTLKYKLDRLSLERVYFGFIRPLMEYADVVWDSPLEILAPLENIQRNAARIVTGATARCPTEGLYNETSWEPLNARRRFHRLVQFFKISIGKAPETLIGLLPGLVQERTGYNLRNRGNFDPAPSRLNCSKHSFFASITDLWNRLPNAMKSLRSVPAFKAAHKKLLPKRNPLYYFGERLESCIHARLRIGNSPLKADLCDILHVIDSPVCSCTMGRPETAKHFFYHCPTFTAQRATLADELLPLNIRNVDHLLFGVPHKDHIINLKVFKAVHKYIRTTKRFY
jgi:hypothetical protein